MILAIFVIYEQLCLEVIFAVIKINIKSSAFAIKTGFKFTRSNLQPIKSRLESEIPKDT